MWRCLPALAIAFLAATPAAGQVGSVTGRIVGGTTGQPLAGVQVSIEGTGRGTVTDNDGRFLILNVPTGERRVVLTMIGYGEKELPVTVAADEVSNLGRLALYTRAVQLEGVVVTGTAIGAQKREIGNSISLITAEQIQASGARNLDEILRGAALGTTVQGNTGMAGAGSQILIRGLGSIFGRNRPLIYVDGVRMNDRGSYESATPSDQAATVLNSINPADIERIEVIKGAAASTLYGTEASAGVIQIFTKQGAAGQQRWTASIEQGVAVPTHMGPDEDPTGLHVNDCTTGGPLRPADGADPGCPASGSWLKNAHQQRYELSVRGGVEQFNYFASAGWSGQDGIVNVPDQYDPQQSRTLNFRGNFTFRPWQVLELRMNNSYARRDINWIQDGDNSRGFLENVTKLEEGETPENVDSLVFQSDIDQEIDHFTTALNVNYNPTDNFSHRLSLGLDLSRSVTITFEPLGFWDFQDGSRTWDEESSRLITLDYAGSLHHPLPRDLTSTFSWGGQFNDREDTGFRLDCIRFVAPGRRLANECQAATFEGGGLGLQEDRRGFRTGGGFVQELIGWKNRLFLTAGVRADAFSQVNQDLELDYKFLLYPKLSATYTLSDHDFWPSDWFDTFRLRAAWGQSGDPPPQTANQTLWQVAGADEIPESGYIIQSLANPDIEAERTTEWEAGLDASLLNGRLSLQGQYFLNRTTKGILFEPLLPSGGVVENVPRNAGEWKRWGIEVGADATLLERDNVRLSVNGQYEWRDDEVVSLGSLGQGSPQRISTGGFNQYFVEGKPFPIFMGEPVMNPDEIALPVRDTFQVLGRSIPNRQLSLGISATLFNRLTLDLSGAGQFGHLMLDEGAEELATDGVWPQCIGVDDAVLAHINDDVPLPADLTAGRIARCSSLSSVNGVPLAGLNEDWLFDADFFRIQSAALTYRVPERWLPARMSAATIQFRATNLHVFHDVPTGTDPDALLGAATFDLFRSNGFTIPPPRTYSVSLRVNF